MIMHTLTSGQDMYVPWVEPIAYANAFQAWPSFSMLMPRSEYNGSDPVYVTVEEDDTVTASFTWSQASELLEASGRNDAADMVTLMNAAGYDTTVDPMVNNMMCWYTSDISTEESYVFNTSDLRNEPEILYGFGDGVGTVATLDVCKSWDPSRTTVQEFSNISHSAYMTDETIVGMLVDLFTS
uniref:Uncharacterized protein n=1 Tax=Octactis speculum TaxID=3111310 RepID=A0A7S2FAH9_9STRA